MIERLCHMIGRFACRTICWLWVLTVLIPSGTLAEAAKPLPVVSIAAESLTDWKDKKDVRQATLTYSDESAGLWFTMPITIHIQGNSSLKLEKKNFTIKFDRKMEVHRGWGAHKKYCLKSNFIDPTHAGNIVSARLAAQMQRRYDLFKNAPNAGLVDGFPVWVVLNGRDRGLYTWNIPKDEWMLGMDKDDPDHIAMFAEKWRDEVFFQADKVNYKKGWSFEVGKNSRKNQKKFERLYRFVRDATDEEFQAKADRYLDLDACINYYCFICIGYAPDNIAKKMLLVAFDGLRWAPSLYDLDSLWGINWQGTGYWDVDSEIGIEQVIQCGGLFGRIRDCFPEEVRARYAELRQYPLSKENIRAEFERFRAQIPKKYYDMDWALWYSDDIHIRTYERTYRKLDEYLPIVDAAFGYTEESAPQDDAARKSDE